LLSLVALAAGLACCAAFGCGAAAKQKQTQRQSQTAVGASTKKSPTGSLPPATRVEERIETFFDPRRGRELKTEIYFPEWSHPTSATRGKVPGPYPLVVFGHGFSVTPDLYRPLIEDWVKSGYVVAAPFFPGENEDAPGGPNERDLPNEPGDLDFVAMHVEQMGQPDGALHGRLSQKVAVAGQSDGGDAALAAATDPATAEYHFDAAMIMSGAEDPFAAQFHPQSGTPVLAIQGTSDQINKPVETQQYYSQLSPPHYLLELIGATHLEPYTAPDLFTEAQTGPGRHGEPESLVYFNTTTKAMLAFLAKYLKGEPSAFDSMLAEGTAGQESRLSGVG